MTQLPYLNVGCGRVILPAPVPGHYGLIDPGLTEYALWHNIDRNGEPGVDQVVDVFRYPWPFADNSFDGALCAHLVEHIPHEIKPSDTDTKVKLSIAMGGAGMREDIQARALAVETRARELAGLQDGWYAFFAELHRVLTPGSIIHVLSPYAWSQGAVTDPTHTRLITEHTFTHSMQPDPNSPFKYATGGLNLEMVEPARFTLTGIVKVDTREEFEYALRTKLNVVYELYAKLRVIKE